MSKWREVKLSNIINIISGGTPKTSISEYWDGDIPWLSIKDFNGSERMVYKTEKCITELGVDRSATTVLKKGDLIISARGTIGELAQLGSDMAFNQSCYGITAKDCTSNEYLYYLLNYSKLLLINIANGATFGTIIRKTFDYIKIQLPDLETQEKIADILSTYDRLIENNNRRIEILEKTAEEIYKEWFVRMRFPGYENTKFIKGIPEGWEVRKFINKDVKLISSGINAFEGLKRYLATADVEGISLKYGEDITFTERPSRANMQPKENTIWFAKMQDTIKHLYFRNHSQRLMENIILSTGFAGIEFKNINHYYYYLSFIRYGIFEDIKNMYANGSTQVAINNQNIKRIRLLMPDKGLLNVFNNIIELNFEMIEKYKEQNQNLIKQRDLLLPRLMNGTIEVK